jgi:hypothetical protein
LLTARGVACVGVRLRDYNSAVADCTKALAIDERNIKALHRRAQSYMALDGAENIEARAARLCLPSPLPALCVCVVET